VVVVSELPRSTASRPPVTLPPSSRRSTGGAGIASNPGTPGAPAHLEAGHVSARYVTLTWEEPSEHGASPVVGYTLYWRELGSDRSVPPPRCVAFRSCSGAARFRGAGGACAELR